MKIVAFSDIHWQLSKLSDVPEGDVLVYAMVIQFVQLFSLRLN